MTRPAALVLAIAATATAVSMSVLAGWQRGGWLSERLVWVAVSVVLVGGAHMLPALCRAAPLAVRCTSVVLWLGCMAAASWGHATFLLLAQSHAGEARVLAMPVVNVPAHRTLTAVMVDRASVETGLAIANARHCIRDCPALTIRRTSLAARLDALNAEAADVRRYQLLEDANAAHRHSVHDDPVTAQVALLTGMVKPTVGLLTGIAFAAILEGMACLLWWIALLPEDALPVTDDHRPDAVVIVDTPAVTSRTAASTPADHDLETVVIALRRDIAAGLVRPTVASIRRHLGCAQAKAAALRKLVIDNVA